MRERLSCLEPISIPCLFFSIDPWWNWQDGDLLLQEEKNIHPFHLFLSLFFGLVNDSYEFTEFLGVLRSEVKWEEGKEGYPVYERWKRAGDSRERYPLLPALHLWCLSNVMFSMCSMLWELSILRSVHTWMLVLSSPCIHLYPPSCHLLLSLLSWCHPFLTSLLHLLISTSIH